MSDKIREPPADAMIVDRAVGEMLMALLGARQLHACGAARGPAAHHRVRYLGVKLDREGGAHAKRLDWKDVALGKKLRAARQCEALAMPLIHMIRPVADRASGRCGANRIVPDLGLAFGMWRDPLAQILR